MADTGQAPPPLSYRTRDHPAANGRAPRAGEREWVLTFPLDDGRELAVRIGKTGHAALLHMLHQEMRDDEFEEGRTDGG